MRYLIWATDHAGWWMPDRCGYSPNVAYAGRYSGEEVADILANDMLNEQRVCREDEHESMASRVAREAA
jgi:hypothetical protein